MSTEMKLENSLGWQIIFVKEFKKKKRQEICLSFYKCTNQSEEARFEIKMLAFDELLSYRTYTKVWEAYISFFDFDK